MSTSRSSGSPMNARRWVRQGTALMAPVSRRLLKARWASLMDHRLAKTLQGSEPHRERFILQR